MSIGPTATVSMALLVLYTDHLEESRRFYSRLGLTFHKEQHGNGPEHYAAVLPDGVVIELYPATERRPATSARLGFNVTGHTMTPPMKAGRHLLDDPDGRTVEVHAGPAGPPESEE
ncbi:VOC family protein [Spirillospora sp. CA-142024]|uniref:VOC family protein n=1 Tax=Spirillospora sp. CA-142024 TaxID=3240036 RepID=UPI003D8E1142